MSQDWVDDSYMYGERETTSVHFKRPAIDSPSDKQQRRQRKKRTPRDEDEDGTFSIPSVVVVVDPPLSSSSSAVEQKYLHQQLIKYENGGEGGGGGGGGETTCRACKVGYFVTEDAFVDKIAAVIRKYAFVLSRQALIHAIYELSQTQRETIVNEGEDDPGEWTHEEIEHHLFNCMTDSGLIFLKQISDLKDELTSLQKMLWKTNADGTREIDKNVFSVYLATQKQIKDFLSMAPEKTLAFNPKLSVQLSTRRA